MDSSHQRLPMWRCRSQGFEDSSPDTNLPHHLVTCFAHRNAAIKKTLDTGQVKQEGVKKGARYGAG